MIWFWYWLQLWSCLCHVWKCLWKCFTLLVTFKSVITLYQSTGTLIVHNVTSFIWAIGRRIRKNEVSLDTASRLPLIWYCTLPRDSGLQLLDYWIPNCVGCIFRRVPCPVPFFSTLSNEPQCISDLAKESRRSKIHVETGAGHLAQLYCSSLAFPRPWVPPLHENNWKWVTHRDVGNPSISDWV